MPFRIHRRSKKSAARVGAITTPHGTIRTPCFMAIATRGAVKGLLPGEAASAGAEILLSNTYHLWLRPGPQTIRKHGGLHRFMAWHGPILTDSGGFQVFSLGSHCRIAENGVMFRDPLDGKQRLLTPELSIRIQRELGSDLMMALDECTPYPASRRYAEQSMHMTTRWAQRCLSVRRKKGQQLFGIVQGSTYDDLRRSHAAELAKLPFDGFAIGGVSVGEPESVIHRIIRCTAPLLPKEKPRYVMGIGRPHQLVYAVRQGIDMFDCVLPTRDGRHGRLYVWKKDGKKRLGTTKGFYSVVNAKNARFANDIRPVDANCPCPLCTAFSRGYLRHLFVTNELLGQRLATIHNLTFYLSLMAELRKKIRKGRM
ncbi:MAG: tRNA guanosine(34) transglycosylase Tgt [bacterium]